MYFLGNIMQGTSKSYEGFHIRMQYLVWFWILFVFMHSRRIRYFTDIFIRYVYIFFFALNSIPCWKNLKIYWRTHLKFKLCLLFLHFIHICQELATTISASKHMKSYSHKHWYTQTHMYIYFHIYIFEKKTLPYLASWKIKSIIPSLKVFEMV